MIVKVLQVNGKKLFRVRAGGRDLYPELAFPPEREGG
jgi:hypothetical protein